VRLPPLTPDAGHGAVRHALRDRLVTRDNSTTIRVLEWNAICACAALVVLGSHPAQAAAEPLLPGFAESAPFDEQVRWTRHGNGVRVCVVAPRRMHAPHRQLVVFATPNGNTIEQTLGCVATPELDWRFDIQHVGAQIRRVRELDKTRDLILVVVQSPQLSWPAFRREQSGANDFIRDLLASLVQEFAAGEAVLSCHSGGGSFVWGYLNAVDALPAWLTRVVFLDANYSYSDAEAHGDKLLAWLRGDARRHLVVIAYDDREVTLNGKKIVGDDGGTFRASQRMLVRFRRDVEFAEQKSGSFQFTQAQNGQIQFFIHPNPDNKILHTALVGEMNGLLHGLLLDGQYASRWGTFGGPRAYTPWIRSAPLLEPERPRACIVTDVTVDVRFSFPPRSEGALTGSQFLQQLEPLTRDQREVAVVREILAGNVPDFLRRPVALQVQATDTAGAGHSATFFVMADYLAVGVTGDFFRIPMTPRSAVAIADRLNATLITTKVADDVFLAAQCRLEPKPLTQDRESVASFYQHHQIIEAQLGNTPRGQLVAGIKKDVVLTNRLGEKPHKVAIFGWHYPDGRPIQPLYVGHVDWYVDYSHGVRLLAGQVIADGKVRQTSEVLQHPLLHVLLSDEGPIDVEAIRRAAKWETD